MKFFLPFANTPELAESTYTSLKKFVEEYNWPVKATRYRAVYYRHNGRETSAVVGQDDPLTGEPVIAIFRAAHEGGPFLICTQNRGVLRGDPILAEGNSLSEEFELDPSSPRMH
jgi:hypothetical protein